MNCKPGDLAVIVRPWSREQDIGRPVTVVRMGAPGSTVQMRGGLFSTAVGPLKSQSWLCDASGPGFPCFIADECLRPIRDQAGEDESLQWARVPHKEVA